MQASGVAKHPPNHPLARRRPTDPQAPRRRRVDPNGGGTATAERVQTIVDLMIAGRWVPRVTAQCLSIAWGVSYQAVATNAAEALRMIARPAADPEQRDAAIGHLWRIVQDADPEDARSVTNSIRAMELITRLNGDQAPQRVDVTLTPGVHSADAARELAAAVAAELGPPDRVRDDRGER